MSDDEGVPERWMSVVLTQEEWSFVLAFTAAERQQVLDKREEVLQWLNEEERKPPQERW